MKFLATLVGDVWFQLVADFVQAGAVRMDELHVEAEGLEEDALCEQDFVGHLFAFLLARVVGAGVGAGVGVGSGGG